MLAYCLDRDFPTDLRDFHIPHDPPMMNLMQGRMRPNTPQSMRQAAQEIVRPWMEKYGVLQGIEGSVRDQVALCALKVVPTVQLPNGLSREQAVSQAFETVYRALYNTHQRGWTSMTSKLLWCHFPDEIVIFDSFVERAITVLQWVEPALQQLDDQLGSAPSNPDRIEEMVAYYMRYQTLVFALYQHYSGKLDQLCELHPNPNRCPHPLRLFDRFLWGLGSP